MWSVMLTGHSPLTSRPHKEKHMSLEQTKTYTQHEQVTIRQRITFTKEGMEGMAKYKDHIMRTSGFNLSSSAAINHILQQFIKQYDELHMSN